MYGKILIQCELAVRTGMHIGGSSSFSAIGAVDSPVVRDALTGTGDTLENTIRRMTGAPADRFKLSDRGYIRPGCFADLTVFDEKEIRAAQPDQEKPFGIRQVFINGKQVLSEGTLDKEALKTTGRAIRVG